MPEFAARQAKFEEDILLINEIMLRVAAAQQRTNEILVTIAEKHLELEESHKRLSKLHESTEARLNALIAAVDRHIENHK